MFDLAALTAGLPVLTSSGGLCVSSHKSEHGGRPASSWSGYCRGGGDASRIVCVVWKCDQGVNRGREVYNMRSRLYLGGKAKCRNGLRAEHDEIKDTDQQIGVFCNFMSIREIQNKCAVSGVYNVLLVGCAFY